MLADPHRRRCRAVAPRSARASGSIRPRRIILAFDPRHSENLYRVSTRDPSHSGTRPVPRPHSRYSLPMQRARLSVSFSPPSSRRRLCFVRCFSFFVFSPAFRSNLSVHLPPPPRTPCLCHHRHQPPTPIDLDFLNQGRSGSAAQGAPNRPGKGHEGGRPIRVRASVRLRGGPETPDRPTRRGATIRLAAALQSQGWVGLGRKSPTVLDTWDVPSETLKVRR